MPVSRKRKKNKRKAQKKPTHKPYQVVKQPFVEWSPPDFSDIPFEKRIEILQELANRSNEDYEKASKELQYFLNDYDQLYLISFCVLYFLSHVEGIDQEAIDGYVDFPPFYIEVLQAMSLMRTRTISARPLADHAAALKETLTLFNKSQSRRYFNLVEGAKRPEDISPAFLRMDMMIHTLAVRNWAYEDQMQGIAYDLAECIAQRFVDRFGYSPFVLLDMIFGLVEFTNTKLNRHIGKMRRVAQATTLDESFDAHESNYPDIDATDPDKRRQMWKLHGKKLRNIKETLLIHGDIRLPDVLTFSIEEIRSLVKSDYLPHDGILMQILGQLSLEFGDLKDVKKDHIFLNNPIHSKPFIKLKDGDYFSGITYMFSHLGVDLLETFIKEDDALFSYYTRQKGHYLERQIRLLFETAFPGGNIFDGSLWENPEDGKTYENDLIVLIEDFAIIIEAKSGTVTSPARRGAPNRLFETLKELVVAPSEQAIRFERFLKLHPAIHSFKTKNNKTHTIDSSKIKYFVPLGVTLSNLGSIGCNLKKLIDAKIITCTIDQLAPSISLSDLQVIFEILPLEAQKIHYLSRRREFEAHVRFEGDELDLFGFYMDTGFNIGDTEYDSTYHLNLTLKSKELDPYFIGKHRGVKIKKPEPSMTKFWSDLLNFLHATSKVWLQVSYMLLNASKQDQVDFEKALTELKKRVRQKKTELDQNYMAFYCGPPRRRYTIIGYVYQGLTKAERNDILNQIAEKEKDRVSRGFLILGFDLDSEKYPFNVIAGSLFTDFFDRLTNDGSVIPEA